MALRRRTRFRPGRLRDRIRHRVRRLGARRHWRLVAHLIFLPSLRPAETALRAGEAHTCPSRSTPRGARRRSAFRRAPPNAKP
jgi:hypothetical protein